MRPLAETSSKTRRLDAGDVAEAAKILRAGGTVAFPTETVYGLGANALDAEAVAKVFAAKQRPAWDPLIVHVSDRAMLERVAVISPLAEVLLQRFWPGPLTLLLERRAEVPESVTAGRPLVGVRMPDHHLALQLIRSAGVPLAAPSANRFGHTSPTTAAHVLADLDGRIDAVLDGGPCHVGVESTVLDLNQRPLVLYRPGAVTAAQIEAATGERVVTFEAPAAGRAVPASLPSPGVGLRHYAPRATLLLVEEHDAEAGKLASLLADKALMEAAAGRRVGVMLPKGWSLEYEAGGAARMVEYEWGEWTRPEELAARLYDGLRWLDDADVDVLLCPVPPGAGLGAALLDRLKKASAPA